MELAKGTDIYATDGEKVGSIERVVLDPQTKEVTHVVIEKGFLFQESKVVPISMLGSETKGGISLRDSEFLEELPSFRESEYIASGVETPQARERAEEAPARKSTDYPSQYAPGYYWYPPVGVGWWRGLGSSAIGEPEYTRVVEYNIPEGTVAVEEGASVITSDDKHVGDLEEILTDPQENRATHFVISSGLLLKKKKLIPAHWVRTVLDEEIYLTVSSELVKGLPDYEREPA